MINFRLWPGTATAKHFAVDRPCGALEASPRSLLQLFGKWTSFVYSIAAIYHVLF